MSLLKHFSSLSFMVLLASIEDFRNEFIHSSLMVSTHHFSLVDVGLTSAVFSTVTWASSSFSCHTNGLMFDLSVQEKSFSRQSFQTIVHFYIFYCQTLWGIQFWEDWHLSWNIFHLWIIFFTLESRPQIVKKQAFNLSQIDVTGSLRSLICFPHTRIFAAVKMLSTDVTN